MTITRITLATMALLGLSACSELDMQGHDPKEFYKNHPKENRVERRSMEQTVYFGGNSSKLSGDQLDTLRRALSEASPQATSTVEIQLHRSQFNNQARRTHFTKLLRGLGYDSRKITFTSSDAL